MTTEFYMHFSVGPRKDTPREDYRVDRLGIKTMKQSRVAFVGRCVVVAVGDEFWGGEKSKSYTSKVMENPTWRQLFACAKAAQRKTLDLHHSFFEGVYPQGIVDTPEGQVTELQLSLGS